MFIDQLKGAAQAANERPPAWKAGVFIGYALLALVIPIAGFVLGRAAIARGGKRLAQGVALFVIALLSTFIYGAIFTAIFGRNNPFRT